MFVYVMASEGGMCKVGVARDPELRLGVLITGHPFKLSVAAQFAVDEARAFQIEKAAHAILAEKRMRGEWFSVSVEEASAAVQSAIDDPHQYQSPSPQAELVDPPVLNPQVVEELGEDLTMEIMLLCLDGLGKKVRPNIEPSKLEGN